MLSAAQETFLHASNITLWSVCCSQSGQSSSQPFPVSPRPIFLPPLLISHSFSCVSASPVSCHLLLYSNYTLHCFILITPADGFVINCPSLCSSQFCLMLKAGKSSSCASLSCRLFYLSVFSCFVVLLSSRSLCSNPNPPTYSLLFYSIQSSSVVLCSVHCPCCKQERRIV